MIPLKCLLQYLGLAESYCVQHILVDMTFLIFLLEDLQGQALEIQKKHLAFGHSICVAKNYQKHIYFVLELGEPALP